MESIDHALELGYNPLKVSKKVTGGVTELILPSLTCFFFQTFRQFKVPVTPQQ